MATRLQKPADPCMWGTSAGLQKEKEAHSWSKMMMMLEWKALLDLEYGPYRLLLIPVCYFFIEN